MTATLAADAGRIGRSDVVEALVLIESLDPIARPPSRSLRSKGPRQSARDPVVQREPFRLVNSLKSRDNAKHRGADHAGVARLLIASGSPLDWTPPSGAPGPERTLEGLNDLRRDAMAGEPA